MKFLVDMGISPKTVVFLKNLGYDAVHLLDQGLNQLGDPDILKKAQEEARILLTHDLDFGELVSAGGLQLPSVVTFRLRNMKPENLNRYLEIILKQHGKLLETGVILTVEEGKIRSRLLLIQRE